MSILLIILVGFALLVSPIAAILGLIGYFTLGPWGAGIGFLVGTALTNA